MAEFLVLSGVFAPARTAQSIGHAEIAFLLTTLSYLLRFTY